MKKIVISWICIMTFIFSTVSVSAKLSLLKETTETSVREFLFVGDSTSGTFASSGIYNIKGSATNDETFRVGEIKKETVLGKNFRHFDFDSTTINGTFGKTSNLIRIQLAYKDQPDDTIVKSDGSIQENAVKANITKPYNILGTDKAYMYTFYGYSDNNTGGTLWKVDFMRSTSSAGAAVNMTNDYIYSANGVPHRIDVIVYATGTTSDDYMRVALYVDGVYKDGGAYKIGTSFATSRLTIYRQLDVKNGVLTIPDFSHHFSYMFDLFTSTNVPAISRTEVEKLMVTKPNWCDSSDGTDKELCGTTQNFVIENVSDELETEINAVLQNSDVEKSIDVMSLEGLITAEGTAKLIKKSDGTVVEDVSTVTTDDVVLEVNGIYLSLNQKEIIPGYESLVVDENGNASLTLNKVDDTAYSADFIIAGYDTKGSLISCKIFDVDVKANDDVKQYVITRSYLVDGAVKYKAFAFKSILDPVPLVENGDSSK